MRIKGLDYLRVYGIGLVLVYHIFKEFLPAGFLGVNIMFVLSGFLVSFHLLDEVYTKDEIDLVSYYKKRFIRIFPGVFFMVFVVSILAIFINRDYTVHFFDQFIAALSFTSNYYEILTGGSYESQFISHLFLHTWFLAIEIHFYLLWPILTNFIYRMSEKSKNVKKTFSNRFFLVSFILYVLSLGLTIILTALDKNRSFVYFSDFTRLSSFFMGAIVACFVKRFGFRKIPYSKATIGCAIIILIMSFALSYDMKITYILGFFLTDLLTIIAILAAFSNQDTDEVGIVKRIAPYTYSIYLIHWPIFVIMKSFANKPTALLLTLIFTGLLVAINYHIFEPFFRGDEISFMNLKVNPKARVRMATISAIMLISFVSASGLSFASADMVSLEKNIWISSVKQDLDQIKKDKKDLDRQIFEEENPDQALKDGEVNTTVFGDSVLLGNREYIEENIKGTSVNAEGSRLLESGEDLIKEAVKENNLGKIVVIALGTNAIEDPETSIDKMIKAVPKGTKVIVVSCYDNRYEQPHRVSVAMKKIAEKYKFVTYMPWEEEAMKHPEYYQGTDGVHFYGHTDAYEAYNKLLKKAILEASKKEGK